MSPFKHLLQTSAKKTVLATTLATALVSSIQAATITIIPTPKPHANLATGYIRSIVARSEGTHALTLSVSIANPVGCSHADRVIIHESDPGGKFMLDVAFQAWMLGLPVQIAVSGNTCTLINPSVSQGATAPTVMKILLR
ncbi:MAG: hypothetical protein KDK04_25400 [Candidatus Competibacteraceae bacterium]|nr:hypothetical protein [Candidatus Competibacteraceae bacterium]